MRKYKGFNFVELMLVMAVLGIVIALTFPLLRDIKDDEDVYRAYMKKANQDITDALAMALIKNRYVRDVSFLEGKLSGNLPATIIASYNAENGVGIRNFLNSSIGGKTCEGNVCLTNITFVNEDASTSVALGATDPGIILGGNAAMMVDKKDGIDDVYAHIYMDMNGNKSPNKLCKDRYRFIMYKDRVALDETIKGCSLAL